MGRLWHWSGLVMVLVALSATQARAAPAQGHLDLADNYEMVGWASDPDFAGAIQVHVYVDGVLATALVADQFHSAAVGDHGFTWHHSGFGPGLHSVYVYAIGVNSAGQPDNANPRLSNSPLCFSQGAPTIRLMSYNIAGAMCLSSLYPNCLYQDSNAQLQKIADTLVAQQITIAGLQEVEIGTSRHLGQDMVTLLRQKLAVAGYPMQYRWQPTLPVDGGQDGQLLLSRCPIDADDALALPGGAGAKTNTVDWIQVGLGPVSWRVFNVHPSPGTACTAIDPQYVSYVAGYQAETSFLMGDYNMLRTAPCYPAITATHFESCLEGGDPSCDFTVDLNVRPDLTPPANAIDFIFHRFVNTAEVQWELTSAWVDHNANTPLVVSDHFPVFAEFNLYRSPTGVLDVCDCTDCRGWAADADDPHAPVSVRFYSDGPAGVGQLLGEVSADAQREEAVCRVVNGANCGSCPAAEPQCQHGFVWPLPYTVKDDAPHEIYAYGVNLTATGGTDLQLMGAPKTVQCTCTPDCTGRVCGGDGCGGSCGDCQAPGVCDNQGRCSCFAPAVDCGTVCVDVRTDPQHCGTCDQPCASPSQCVSGECLLVDGGIAPDGSNGNQSVHTSAGCNCTHRRGRTPQGPLLPLAAWLGIGFICWLRRRRNQT